ncbi:hypothetical protein [Nocardia sp. NPDC004860]|uniref:hypothetical protein n=1 Tax=Nocardia sp. NPDC004860 TaxID=3154557 RepID=UPI0033B5DE28
MVKLAPDPYTWVFRCIDCGRKGTRDFWPNLEEDRKRWLKKEARWCVALQGYRIVCRWDDPCRRRQKANQRKQAAAEAKQRAEAPAAGLTPPTDTPADLDAVATAPATPRRRHRRRPHNHHPEQLGIWYQRRPRSRLPHEKPATTTWFTRALRRCPRTRPPRRDPAMTITYLNARVGAIPLSSIQLWLFSCGLAVPWDLTSRAITAKGHCLFVQGPGSSTADRRSDGLALPNSKAADDESPPVVARTDTAAPTTWGATGDGPSTAGTGDHRRYHGFPRGDSHSLWADATTGRDMDGLRQLA